MVTVVNINKAKRGSFLLISINSDKEHLVKKWSYQKLNKIKCLSLLIYTFYSFFSNVRQSIEKHKLGENKKVCKKS